MTTTTVRPRPFDSTTSRQRRIPLPRHLIVGNRQTLRAAVFDALDAGARRIELDFGATDYVDASGLGVLVSVNKCCHERGAELVLIGLGPSLRDLFERYRLDMLFRIEDPAPRAAGAAGETGR